MSTGYSLPVGVSARDRLALVEHIYGPRSRQLLLGAGLREGWRVAELGCGTGSTIRWLLEQVGTNGNVVGVDASEAQLAVAGAAAPRARLVRALAHETGLEAGGFDLVYMRLLLAHVPDPREVLGHAWTLLVPGGVVVCEDLTIDSTFCDPPVAAQSQLHAIASDMAARRGADFNVGRRLYHHARAAGFTNIVLSSHQPVYGEGVEKRLEELSFREAIPAVVALGEHTTEELTRICDSLRDAAEDPDVVYGLSAMFQLVGRKAL